MMCRRCRSFSDSADLYDDKILLLLETDDKDDSLDINPVIFFIWVSEAQS